MENNTRAELDSAKAFNDHHGYLRDYMTRQVFSELARLTKEVEELRKDKERLDWLDDILPGDIEDIYKSLDLTSDSIDLRDAIDSAMQQKGEE